MEILSVKGLNFKYPASASYAVKNVDFSINKGDITVLCGASGCGKTTLLRLLKREITPFGEKNGEISYCNTPLDDLDDAFAASRIGFVMQDPDSQIVTDTVWQELAFGLENLGVERSEIRRRVGEMASYFGIHGSFRQSTDSLSGGQKQMLNLASVMVMQPDLLLLDEPTSRLDPIAADEFISTLYRLNGDFGITVVIAEHRLDAILPIADRVLVMDNGELVCNTSPQNICKRLGDICPDHPVLYAMPSAVRIYNSLASGKACPLTVKDCKTFLSSRYGYLGECSVPSRPACDTNRQKTVEVKNVSFRYDRNSHDVLRRTSLTAYSGEIMCLLGGNGAGKSTLFSVISGLLKPYEGKVLINGKAISSYHGNELYSGCLAYLPQEPKTLFTNDSVMSDMLGALSPCGISGTQAEELISDITSRLGITSLLQSHPYDLSGGEQQKCAMAKILLGRPRILLLDEPTKGLDAAAKRVLGEILSSLASDGISLILITHDLDFAAEYCDRCALLFDGEIISESDPREFFAHNSFYTTSASRISRGVIDGAVTVDDVITTCREREKT